MRRTLALLSLVAGSVVVAAPPAGASLTNRWWRPAMVRGTTWHLRTSQTSGPADIEFTYGRPGDTPLMGDWDGDGSRTPGVVRIVDGHYVWLLRNHLGGGPAEVTFTFGRVADPVCSGAGCVIALYRPVAGDWDGNRTETPALLKPDGSSTIVMASNHLAGGAAEVTCERPDRTAGLQFGDWDGNGGDSPAVEENGHWKLYRGLCVMTPYRTFAFGKSGDQPVAGDWDRDGQAGPGVVRLLDDNTRQWLLRDQQTSGRASVAFTFGRAGDTPLVW